MVGWVVFGEVVRGVVSARSPVDIELLLRDTILEPVVSHIERLGAFETHLRMKNSVGS
jgi:hypothetical protein